MSDRDDPTAAEISETAKLAKELHFAFLDSSGYYPDRIAVYLLAAGWCRSTVNSRGLRDELSHDLVDWWHAYGISGPQWEVTQQPLPLDLLEAAEQFIDYVFEKIGFDQAT